MKKPRILKEKGRILLVVILLFSVFLLIINFIPIFLINAGWSAEFTGDLSRDYSIYVNQSNPDMNYEDSWSSVISKSCETYIHFNLESLPMETEQLYIFMWSYDFGVIYPPPVEDIEINIIFVDSNWNISEITWNNKPQHEYIIDTVNASDIIQSPFVEYYNLEKTVDLTNIFQDNELKEISFCFNITEKVTMFLIKLGALFLN